MSRFLASCFAIIVLATMAHGADDAKSTVSKLDEAWLDAYKAADFDRLAAIYADDALVMPTFSEPVQGREAIRNFFTESVKDVPKRSMEIFICEGERDADNVIQALASDKMNTGLHIAATTNFDGAGKWKNEYSVFFAGKKVVIFPDNDEPGSKHAERVAESVYPYALGVKVVQLAGLPQKGDVSDFLKARNRQELIEEIRKTPRWHPVETGLRLFVAAPQFVSAMPTEVNWMIEGLIESGAKGFFCAAPKAGKSWAATDLAISLAIGGEWMGFHIPRPIKVALVSREDNPSLTAWRIRNLFAGKSSGTPALLETNLHVNSRSQSRELMLDNPEQMAELMGELKQLRTEFAIFDVFNVLHAADENDNTEMRGVLRVFSQLQAETGCAIGIVHHYSKAEQGSMSMTQRLRGASAIAGWAEWLIGISMADGESKTRRMDFELKAAQPPAPLYYRIQTSPGSASLEPVTHAPQQHGRQEGSEAARLMTAN